MHVFDGKWHIKIIYTPFLLALNPAEYFFFDIFIFTYVDLSNKFIYLISLSLTHYLYLLIPFIHLSFLRPGPYLLFHIYNAYLYIIITATFIRSVNHVRIHCIILYKWAYACDFVKQQKKLYKSLDLCTLWWACFFRVRGMKDEKNAALPAQNYWLLE